MKPLKPPKPKRRARRSRPWARRRPRGARRRPSRTRTWKARHWAVILAAPLLLVVGGVVAYAKLTEHAPIGQGARRRGPRRVLRRVHPQGAPASRSTRVAADSRAPGRHDPGPGPGQREEARAGLDGHAHRLPHPRHRALRRRTWRSTTRKAALAQRRASSTSTVTPDYRDDVDVGTVMSTNPGANLQADKSDAARGRGRRRPARGPARRRRASTRRTRHATSCRTTGCVVAVQTASSKTRPAGTVLKSSPGAGTTVVRGDTVTLTVSIGTEAGERRLHRSARAATTPCPTSRTPASRWRSRPRRSRRAARTTPCWPRARRAGPAAEGSTVTDHRGRPRALRPEVFRNAN